MSWRASLLTYRRVTDRADGVDGGLAVMVAVRAQVKMMETMGTVVVLMVITMAMGIMVAMMAMVVAVGR